MEKHLSITSQSLDSLVKTLEVDEFKYVRESFPIAHEFGLIKRKGVYPYDYMDSFTRFEESRMPSQDAFFSKLSDSPFSDTEDAHATQVWTAFECESMADYHDIYMKCDVLLLTDLFQKFRATCLAHYSLDSCLAGTDNRYRHFIEDGIRGGISMITTRYARANATLPAYDANRPRVNLIYLDANNLYGWTMSHPRVSIPPTG